MIGPITLNKGFIFSNLSFTSLSSLYDFTTPKPSKETCIPQAIRNSVSAIPNVNPIDQIFFSQKSALLDASPTL